MADMTAASEGMTVASECLDAMVGSAHNHGIVTGSAPDSANLAGFAIPRLGMGTMALAIEGRSDRETAIRTIHAGLDAGVRYLDTAWSYYLPSAPGTGTPEDLGYGEKLVRDALATWDGPRNEVLVATKTGYRRTREALPQPLQKNPTYSLPPDTDSCAGGMHSDGTSANISPAVTAPVTSASTCTPVQAASTTSVTTSDSVIAPDSATAPDSVPAPTLAATSNSSTTHNDDRQHLQADGSQYGWMADSRPETMIRDAKESAAHLGVEAIDLLYSHGPDPAVPYEDQIGALKQLLDEGVIKHAGISRVNNEQIDIAREILGDGLVAVQNQFSPSHPDPERTMEHCAELGLAFVCWSPLGGFLDAFDQRAYDPFRKIAADRGCSYQRVVLAWELSRYNRLFTIPSARNPQEINDSFAAVDMELTQEELDFLNLRF